MNLLLPLLASSSIVMGGPEPIDADIAWVANDVTVSSEAVAYVTDTAKHQVIRLLPDGTRSVLTGKAQFKGANGIEIDGRYLYVGGERLWRIDLENESVETIGPGISSDNHCYEAGLKLALVPTGFDKTVIAIRVSVR